MDGVDQSRRYDLSMRAINPVKKIDVLEDAVFTLRQLIETLLKMESMLMCNILLWNLQYL